MAHSPSCFLPGGRRKGAPPGVSIPVASEMGPLHCGSHAPAHAQRDGAVIPECGPRVHQVTSFPAGPAPSTVGPGAGVSLTPATLSSTASTLSLPHVPTCQLHTAQSPRVEGAPGPQTTAGPSWALTWCLYTLHRLCRILAAVSLRPSEQVEGGREKPSSLVSGSESC